MAKVFKVSTSEEQMSDKTSGSWISHSGMYNVLIKHAFLSENDKNESTSLSLQLDYNGQEQTIYGAIRLTNNDGTENFAYKVFNKLCVVAGLKNDQELRTKKMTLPIGKQGADKEVEVFTDLDNTPMVLRINLKYSLVDGKLVQNKMIHNCFTIGEPHFSASELVNNVSKEDAKQYKMELEKADKDVYGKGVTEAMVQAWKDADYGKKDITITSAGAKPSEEVDDLPF